MTTTDPPNDNVETPPGVDPAVHADMVLENTLLRAGVDLDTEQGELLREANRGKEIDVENVKRQWELVKPREESAPAEPPAEPRIEGESTQGAERSALAATSAVEPNPMDQDPNDKAVEAGRAALTGARSGTHKDAVATGLHHIFDAASRGDERVLITDEPPGARQ